MNIKFVSIDEGLKMKEEISNVVIYARFSSSKQKETSIEAQLKECYKYCETNGYNVIKEYIDEAVSAKTDNRCNFQQMIKDSSSKKYQAVIVYKLDRFARNRYDSAKYKTILKKNGVKVLSAVENISQDASGILMESVLEGMAEYYSAELAEKVKRNSILNAEKGYFNGGYVPLGYKVVTINLETYKKRKLEIDEQTAPIIREIYEMRAHGTNITDIVDYLNSKNIKSTQNKEFKRTSLQKILRNKKYIGIDTYDEKEYKRPQLQIIDETLFNKVQEINEQHRHAQAIYKAKEEYLLTGKLFCGKCNSLMVGVSGKSSTGNIYNYYRCNKSIKRKCNKKNIRKEYIENIVITKCKELLTDKNINKIARKVHEKCQQENSQNYVIKLLKKREAEINKGIENILKAIESGQNIDILNARLTERKAELNNLQIQLMKEENRIINITEDAIKFFLTDLKNNDINNIRYAKTLVTVLINKIFLYDDRVTIIFNIGNQRIKFNDITLNLIDNKVKQESLFLGDIGSPKQSYTNPV